MRLIGIVAALATAALLGGTVAAAETLRVNTLIFGDAAAVRAMKEVFVPEVEKRTDGRYNVQFFFSGELGGNQESIQQVRDGNIFATIVSGAWMSNTVADIGAASLPFLFPNREVVFKVFEGEMGDALNAKLAEKGFVNLGWMELGFRHLTNAVRPVRKPEDVAGLKIRLQADPVHIATFRQLGANTVQIDGKELFSSLRQGVADGQENPYAIVALLKMYEANQKYLTETGHFYDTMPLLASKKQLDAIPEKDRAIIVQVGRDTVQRQREISAGDDDRFRKILPEKGMEIVQLTAAERQAFVDATRPVYQMVREKLDAAFVDRFVAAVEAAKQ